MRKRGRTCAIVAMDAPVEVLCLIFCAMRDSEPTPYTTASRLAPLCVVGQVCSRWREISLQNPALWAELRLPIQRGMNFSLQGRVVAECVRRAQDLPLKIYLTFTVESFWPIENVDADYFRPVLNEIMLHCER